jgi:hypothetical protein
MVTLKEGQALFEVARIRRGPSSYAATLLRCVRLARFVNNGLAARW